MNEKPRRSHARNYREAPILILGEMNETGGVKGEYTYTHARMYNFDSRGLYFETDRAYPPGRKVSVKMVEAGAQAEDHRGAYTVHYARIKWCKEIPVPGGMRYGMGAQIFETVIQAEIH